MHPKGYNASANKQNYTRKGVLWTRGQLLYPKGGKNMTTLATYVKAKRKEFGLTQEDVSMKSGVGLRFVRELEQGKPTLRMDKVNQVLSLFGASLEPTQAHRS